MEPQPPLPDLPVSVPAGSEEERLAAVRALRLLDTPPNERFDRIARLARDRFGTAVALISLIDERRQWFKSCIGLSMTELPLADNLCNVVLLRGEALVLDDAHADPVYARHPRVIGEPYVRFYAGVPLVLPSGQAVGTLCVADPAPRTRPFDAADRASLSDLAALVMREIALDQEQGRRHDLTGLPNRAQLMDDLRDLGGVAPQTRRALLVIEVMSHADIRSMARAVGTQPMEEGLRAAAARLQGWLPPDVRLYQSADACFALLLPEDGTADHAARAEALVRAMREPFISHGTEVTLPAVGGGVLLDADHIEDALRRATSALHEALRTRALVGWHHPDIDRQHRRAFGLLRDLPGHLAEGHLRLVYQPKFDLESGRFRSVEALLRWHHPRHGNVPPNDFIPLVEATVQIHALTRWVLHAALRQQALWRDQGLVVAVAMNVSARDLEQPDFVETVVGACAAHGVELRQLHLECTETAVTTGRQAMRTLRSLHRRGVHIAIDDFGVGYSNLACLRDMPARLLKVDRTLVAPIAADPIALRLFRSVVTLGRSLGFRVLAEGVEDAATLSRVQQAGCEGAQGYYLSRPLEVPDAEAFLRAKLPKDASA
ncbi:sensor domain-containing phosphodiesterase [uncultured Xylophilus sp.]|uniref:putative bifunctional diguanylate cyclase/phosphodiesterase n=1 Tax=uncultured Xylophilus sp. TaxID=296832 RepID=UPI0025DE5B18|nr:sensor domain-containing phosphodiesterase [uncultured Xylophilus sp.]